ncbi:MAG: T9SS type A sorting domain-containing protein, partial [Bacteroidota bacterium]
FGQYVSGFTGVNGSVSSGDASVNGQAGAMVYALHNNEVAGYAFTNAAGKYSIGGLAPGQYSVFVDNLGFNESSVSNVTIGYTPEGDPMTATADFSISSVLRVESDAPIEVQDFTLDQNYPNPFNPSTTISYAIPQPAQVTLKVYNIVGQEVATLVNGYQTSGRYDVTFNASRMASGVYFYRLQTGSFSNIKKMVLLK